MKAIIIEQPGGTDQFKVVELAQPTPNGHEVVVKVKAISVNPVDAKTRAGKALYGKLKEESPVIIGWDISGEVTETGADVKDFSVGDEVFGMVNFPGHGKAYAEYVTAPASHLALKPKNITHNEAAAATLAALTAWQDLVHEGKVKSGQRVLIHGASGGVGHFAVQIAKHLGAYVVGTSSQPNKDFVLSLGADEHIDYKNQQFEKEVANIDFVLDTVGGENLLRSLEVVKPGGTLLSNLGMSDEVKETTNKKGVHGLAYLVKSDGSDMRELAELLAKGAIQPHVSQTFSWNQMAEAHHQIESGHTVGKVVVTL